MPEIQEEDPMTIDEVADLLRVHRNTVSRHLDKGRFPGAYRVGDGRRGMWRIPRTAVATFIAARQP